MTLSELFAKLAVRSALEEDKAGMCAGQKAAGSTEDFSSCHVRVGKATAAVSLGSDGKARQGLLDTEAHPCLLILQAGLLSLDLQLSLFFLQRDWQAPGLDFCGSKPAVCCTAEHSASEVTRSVQNSFHTPSTDHAPREAQSLLQALVTYQ